jgi:hypothetical protein
MSVGKHLEEAVSRLEEAGLRIEAARDGQPSPENTRAWLEALTDYVQALAEVHQYANESIHEKLHALAGRLGLRPNPPLVQP